MRSLFRKIGVDRVVALQVAQRAWNAAALPLTLLLLTRNLTAAQQGVYYSFSSVQALSVVFEVGMAYVLTQFAAHESALTSHATRGAEARSRLGSLLRLGLKWNGSAALLCLCVLMPAGYVFFARTPGIESIHWQWPWVIFAAASAGMVALSPVYAILDGAGYMADTSRVRFFQTCVSTLILWSSLIGHQLLLAAAWSQLAGLLMSVAGLLYLHGRRLRNIWSHHSKQWKVDYRSEIWPMHWKVALSWLSGYIGFYFTTPLLFKALSPEDAGHYGMTANLLFSATGIASIWVYSKAPKFAQRVAIGEVAAMRRDFASATLRSCLVFLGGVGALFVALWIYPHIGLKVEFFERLLHGPVLLLIALSMFFQHVYGLLNVYFRAFKADPLFTVSVGAATLVAIGLLIASRTGNLITIVMVPLVCNLVACVVATQRYLAAKPSVLLVP